MNVKALPIPNFRGKQYDIKLSIGEKDVDFNLVLSIENTKLLINELQKTIDVIQVIKDYKWNAGHGKNYNT